MQGLSRANLRSACGMCWDLGPAKKLEGEAWGQGIWIETVGGPHSAPHPLHRPLCRDPPNLAPLLTVLPPARASPPPLHPIASACRQSTCDSASRSPRATTTSPDLHLTHAFPTRFGFPPGPAVRTPGPVSTSNTLFWLLEQQGTNTHHPSISLNRPTFSTHQTKPLGEGPSPPSAGLDPHTNQ